MAVMDKLPKEARGSFVWTLLQGRALEVVEHLKDEEYQKEGGDKVIFALLDQRWPERDRTDEIGEHITEIFLLKAKEGELLRTWCARSRECFDRCHRKTGVTFPEEAKGWILLHCSGMSEEQRAVVLARTVGDLKFDTLSQAMRSCFPEFVVPKKRAAAAHYVENEDLDWWSSAGYHDDGSYEAADGEAAEDASFQDVELFLTEHDQDHSMEGETFLEEEVAEVLAATWRDKRQELNKLQRGRKFHKADQLKRSFRIEVEELKKKTQCRRCGQVGHWARECRVKLPSGAASWDSGSKPASSSASLVQHFVCHAVAVGHAPSDTMLDRLRALRDSRDQPVEEVMLVSSPGYAVLDSGCGRSVIGGETLRSFRKIWDQAGVEPPKEIREINVFKFGNGEQEVAKTVVEMPVCLAGRRGLVRAAVIQGKAPLLLSRPALKTLQATMDFAKDQLVLFDGQHLVPMQVNGAGQYIIPVADFGNCVPKENQDRLDGKAADPSDNQQETDSPSDHAVHLVQEGCADRWFFSEDGRELICEHGPGRNQLFTPKHEGCPIPVGQLGARRVSVLVDSLGRVVSERCDEWTVPKLAHASTPEGTCVLETRFEVHCPPTPSVSSPSDMSEEVCATARWSKRQARQLRASARRASDQASEPSKAPKFTVVEVFSPPRFALEGITKGFSCLSADLITGWDFRRPSDREDMRKLIQEHPPELLVLCPPCTWAGGWYHLNRCFMSESERRGKERLTRLFLNFCAELAESQLQAGGRVLFEHPRGSCVWTLPKWEALQRRMHVLNVDMCCYGLKVPSGKLIQKATRLLVSHEDMRCLQRRCPGPTHADHTAHQPIQGSVPGVSSVSKLAGKYPPKFVRAVLRTLKGSKDRFGACLVQCRSDAECLVAARVAALDGQRKEQMLQSLRQIHLNLGHPSNSALVRVLKHGGASQQAMDLARDFQCEVCSAHRRPTPANPAQTQRVTEFNKRVGLDVKYLPGWLPNQKIPALNIVDYGSSLQMMVPLPGKRETADSLRRAFQERWVSWAGRPDELVLDPAQVNLSEALTTPQELSGSIVHATAADAHWQLGKVEVHGGWFARVLEKVLSECAPSSRESWEECVLAAHCKNELIQVYGMTPSQFVFGRNPKVPHNLLDEPLQVIPATAPLYEESIAKAVAVRQAARHAVIALQDDRALRLALSARPRVTTQFDPGAAVAYWRTQKSHEGKVERGGRWHGPAIVLGAVGRNLVVVHKRNIFRCAPEQVRAATTEEQSLMSTPNADLLGIKHLLQNNALGSRQYIDLVPQELPPGVDQPMSEDAHTPLQESPLRVGSVPPAATGAPVPSVPAIDPGTTSADVSGSASSGFRDRLSSPQGSAPFPVVNNSSSAPDEPVEYGPVRRVVRKSPPDERLHRPRAMLQDDFAEMMQEVLPELLHRVLPEGGEASEPQGSSRDPRGTKREASPHADAGPSKRSVLETTGSPDPATGSSHDEGQVHENLFVQLASPEISVETLVLNHINKRSAKELDVIGNEPQLQGQIDEAKQVEWSTIIGRNATRVVYGPEAERVRRKFPNRIMGSRFVVTEKQEEDAPVRVKARWCLQGHLDPDLQLKASAGDLQSPTLSQVGRSLIFQLIASHRWQLRLGDIRGAFLSSGALPEKYRPLYARLPPGGIPGVPSDALIEVLGHVYGLNDAPSAWHKTLDAALRQVGFERSRFDPCLYYMRENGRLTGIYGIHVDDSATGGQGDRYNQAIAQLQQRFEFRKWRVWDGEFCGARYTQDQQTFEITMSQAKFCEKLRPLHLNRRRMSERDSELTSDEVRCLRAINGSLNWLSTQSRPDLSTQVSFSQQSFPSPTVQDALNANQAVRRAKQHLDMPLVFRSLNPDRLALMCHSDAAYANGRDGATQAGYMISFTVQDMNEEQICPWTPGYWKSYRLPRVVNSTLGAEAQAMNTATGMLEWFQLILREALDGHRSLHTIWTSAKCRQGIVLTDCKSLYDHLQSKSAPTLEDKRTDLDVVIIRESIAKMAASLRWIPTDRMLADSLTKESAEAVDLLRACLREGRYQVSEEDTVLLWRAAERQRRSRFRVDNVPGCRTQVGV